MILAWSRAKGLFAGGACIILAVESMHMEAYRLMFFCLCRHGNLKHAPP
jgi:hypothetical protein